MIVLRTVPVVRSRSLLRSMAKVGRTFSAPLAGTTPF
jgi:hypothetical protein